MESDRATGNDSSRVFLLILTFSGEKKLISHALCTIYVRLATSHERLRWADSFSAPALFIVIAIMIIITVVLKRASIFAWAA